MGLRALLQAGAAALASLLAAAPLAAAPRSTTGFQAGVARVEITPEGPIWMAGYGDRTHPSEGAVHPLWAKALALQDARGGRVVIVTADVIGLPRSITDLVAARAQKQYGLDRSQIVFNSSHTHTGPMLRGVLNTMFDLSEEDQRRIADFSRSLSGKLFDLIGAALGNLQPATVSYTAGSVPFAVNRREPTPTGIKIGVNPAGPVDHEVPVLRIAGADGKLRAVVFGYACHNTTLTGKSYQLSGDYAGMAQIALETENPGATALFLMLCGGDQNPQPRGTLEDAERHGKSLAAEVERVLAAPLTAVKGPVRTAFETTELAFALHTRETFEQELNSSNRARVRRAKAMLAAYDARHPVRSVVYPVQAIRFGKNLTLLALGGEVVVDYDLRAKQEFGGNLIVAGYSNDVMSYIPSQRVLREGGYEANDSMAFYGQPGPFAEDVEERVFGAIHDVMRRTGAESRKKRDAR